MRSSARTSWFCLAVLIAGTGCGTGAGDDPASGGSGGLGSGGKGSGGANAGGSGGASAGTGGSGGASAGTGGANAGGSGGSSSGGANSGGTGANAGSGGDGGSLPHTIGECDGLAEVGQWEEITPPGVTLTPKYTGTVVVLEHPQVSGTLYTTTTGDGVFKSTNCGADWEKINTGRNADMLDSGMIWSALIDPVDPEVLYALTGYGPAGLWKTTNGGVDWDQTMPMDMGMPGFVARVSMDRTNHEHIFINFHDNCSGGHTPVCFGESTDGGDSWSVVDFPSNIKNSWGEGTFIIPIDATHWLYENWETYYTSNAGETWGDPHGNAVQGDYFDLDGVFYLPGGDGVMKSTDSGASWTQFSNAGFLLQAVIGDGDRLFALQGFQPPESTFMWTAPYSNTSTWTALETPGTPMPLPAGGTSLAYDEDHHLLYTAAQAAGLWRMVTK